MPAGSALQAWTATAVLGAIGLFASSSLLRPLFSLVAPKPGQGAPSLAPSLFAILTACSLVGFYPTVPPLALLSWCT